MVILRYRASCLTLFILLLMAAAGAPALAGPAAIGSVAGSINALLSGHALLPNTAVFNGDSLEVRDGVAVIAVGNSNRVIFGRDTVASFSRAANEVAVLLSQGSLSMLHSSDATPLRVKAGEISITPVGSSKTFGEVAVLEGSVVITAKEGALQVEDHGATKNVATGETIVITRKGGGGPGDTSTIVGGVATGTTGSANAAATAAKEAGSAAHAATSAANFTRPGSSRPLSLANAAAAAAGKTNSQAVCAPPTLPKRPSASKVVPLAASAGPVCPLSP